MKDSIIKYAKAGYPGLFLVSHEETRVEAELKAVADEIGYSLHVWSVTGGLADTETGNLRDMPDPLAALEAAESLPERSILLMHDMNLFLEDGNPVLIRRLKDTLRAVKATGKMLVLLGCQTKLAPELERELVTIEFSLPDKEALALVLKGIVESAEISQLSEAIKDAALEAAAGLTTVEAENAFALSVIETGSIDPSIIAREKANALRSNGLVEVVQTTESMESIGGRDQLKEWLKKRRNAFSPAAREYGLPSPKGLLIIGIPGSGKSLTAKATASVFELPLLKLDAGKLFGGIVGQSEANLRSAISTAEAISPCVLWIDEIEKGFAGVGSSGSADGGTSARVFGGFLNWMQDKTKPVFVVATANDVSQLPPEFLRKGRFDELFFVDLPNQQERTKIWDIVIQKHRRNPLDFDTVSLAKATETFTGAEIEQAFIDALYLAFDDGGEPGELTVGTALTEIVPLHKLMSEKIEKLRQWASGRARHANHRDAPTTGKQKPNL
jgi:AAA+ superfamily predicted ATPase